MLEIRVERSETIKVTFGYETDALSFKFNRDELDQIYDVSANDSKVRLALEDARKNNAVLREDNERLTRDSGRLAAIAGTLTRRLNESKCGPSCLASITQLKHELVEAKLSLDEMRKSQGEMIQHSPGHGVFLAVKKMAEEFGKKNSWRSIETAPKDGTPIMMVDEQLDITIACYKVPHGWVSGTAGTVIYGPINPTHWMPLPEPPR